MKDSSTWIVALSDADLNWQNTSVHDNKHTHRLGGDSGVCVSSTVSEQAAGLFFVCETGAFFVKLGLVLNDRRGHYYPFDMSKEYLDEGFFDSLKSWFEERFLLQNEMEKRH